MRNDTGSILLGFGIFAGIPATLYAFSELPGGVGFASACMTGALLWLGAHSEKQEDDRERQELAAIEAAAERTASVAPPDPVSALAGRYDQAALAMHYEEFLAGDLEAMIDAVGTRLVLDGTWFMATSDLEHFEFTQTPKDSLANVRIHDHLDEEMYQEWLAWQSEISDAVVLDGHEFCNVTDANDWSPGMTTGWSALWALAKQLNAAKPDRSV